jgi:hypothetical protein
VGCVDTIIHGFSAVPARFDAIRPPCYPVLHDSCARKFLYCLPPPNVPQVGRGVGKGEGGEGGGGGWGCGCTWGMFFFCPGGRCLFLLELVHSTIFAHFFLQYFNCCNISYNHRSYQSNFSHRQKDVAPPPSIKVVSFLYITILPRCNTPRNTASVCDGGGSSRRGFV